MMRDSHVEDLNIPPSYPSNTVTLFADHDATLQNLGSILESQIHRMLAGCASVPHTCTAFARHALGYGYVYMTSFNPG